MSAALGDNVWVLHAGALGDHVMIWPLVRALVRQGARVTVVASASHAALCEREVGGSIGIDSERGDLVRLWRGEVDPSHVDPTVTSVITFVAPPEAAPWHHAAATRFPSARVVFVDRPDRPGGAAVRAELWTRAGVAEHGGVAPRANPTGPLLIYPGAGSAAKALPHSQFGRIADALIAAGVVAAGALELVLGRNELERGETGGAFGCIRRCADLPSLADTLRGARLFIGPDTGPTHLAAQLGVPTLALFGPTDPAIWAPVGPCVTILPSSAPLVDVGRITAAARALLSTA